MKQTASFISAYTADTSGVCSALYELSGLVVMHDASGCNSTYHTHDEPRAYYMDSAVYVSALTEMEAVMGGDDRLVNDIYIAAKELNPNFIAICGTPIPLISGVDFTALAKMCEDKTGIPSFGLATNGMHSYISGISQAYQALFHRFVRPDAAPMKGTVNILGATPLDFSINSQAEDMKALLENQGFKVQSCWSMGTTLDEIAGSASAQVNLVVSSSALPLAKLFQKKYGIPYVAGVPYGEKSAQKITDDLALAAQSRQSITSYASSLGLGKQGVIIGESITSCSLAMSLALDLNLDYRIITPLAVSPELLRNIDSICTDEEDLTALLKDAPLVIADGLYKPIVPPTAKFYNLPHEAFSGRMYRDKLPNLINKPLKKEN